MAGRFACQQLQLRTLYSQHILKKFDELPDAGLTTRVWNLASALRKSFGKAAEAVEATLGLPLADKPAQPPDDIASPLRLADRLLHHLADAFRAGSSGR